MNNHAMIRWELPAPPDRQQNNGSDRSVQLLSHPDDYHCVLLASMGMTMKCISKQTGLSISQIGYRLRKAKVRATDYRNGKTAIANAVMDAAASRVGKLITGELRKVIDV